MPSPVLAVAAFVAFWVFLALALLYFALRGGRGEARASRRKEKRGANGALGAVFAVMLLVFGIGLPTALLIGNHANASSQVGGLKLTSGEKRGRELFGQHCGVCHTLAAANAIGKVGPNLDMLRPAASIVLHTINNGCLPNAPSSSQLGCLGQGVMPANVVAGRDAQNVANFVAKVAGNE